jgi:hypothetical protein
LQLSVVQPSASLQTLATPGKQAPPPHTSPLVQALLSLQIAVLLATVHAPVLVLQPSVVHGLLSLHSLAAPGAQAPPLQTSFWVQASASSQLAVLLANTHVPLSALQLSVVQPLLSSQILVLPAHAPPPQVSVSVHRLPSSQLAVLLTKAQTPVAPLQLSPVHGLSSLQTLAGPGTQAPALQASFCVQASASSQLAVLLANTHAPVTALQLSAVQPLLSLQILVVPAHEPPPQVSVSVHAPPSLQPAVLLTKAQTPVAPLQLSLVHGLPSLHDLAGPGTQAPPLQASFWVQALASSQLPVLLAKTHAPATALQLSVVQPLLSLHTLATPAHEPPLQMSVSVHRLPSSQLAVLLVKAQTPVTPLQLSLVQGLPSPHTLAAPTQAPAPQVSVTVHGSPSSQLLVLLTNVQSPVEPLQLSVVHALLSLQTLAAPAQLPPLHTSLTVQALASSQLAVLLAKMHTPVAPSQLSVVQGLLSLQTVPTPAQVPPPQVSATVHGLPSSQLAVLLAKAHTPVVPLQLSVVQPLLSLHTLAAPLHAPEPHASVTVHGSPSSQPIVLLANTQLPVTPLQLSLVHALPSLQVLTVPAQAALPQTSPVVHGLPSSQGAVLLVNTQAPVVRLQASPVHGLASLHTLAEPAQLPLAQTSLSVHRLPSSHAAVLLANTHAPLVALQLSLVQGLLSLHTLAAPPHAPLLQASPVVHGLPSSHAAVLLANTQAPVATLQLSLVQGLPSLHSLGEPAHAPALQASAVVQALPSSQALVLAAKAQAPVATLQLSVVHGLPSLQVLLGPATQALALQASATVQALPSASHGALLALWMQPSLASQISSVHALPSSQAATAPALHVPAWQLSPTVQTLASASHVLPCSGAGSNTQPPLALSHESAVHGLPSAHTLAAPATHALALH